MQTPIIKILRTANKFVEADIKWLSEAQQRITLQLKHMINKLQTNYDFM
jgi:hypothetical protein